MINKFEIEIPKFKVAVGDSEEFCKVLMALVFLSNNDSLYFHILIFQEYMKDNYNNINTKVQLLLEDKFIPLLWDLFETYKPHTYHNEEDFQIVLLRKHHQHFFCTATARERIDLKKWLKEKLVSRNISFGHIEHL